MMESRWTLEQRQRAATIFFRVTNGSTFKSIGADYGISVSRVMAIDDRVRHILQNPKFDDAHPINPRGEFLDERRARPLPWLARLGAWVQDNYGVSADA